MHFDQTSPEIQYLSQRDKHLGKVIQMLGPLDYQLVTNGYGFLVSQIIGQMLSNKVAAVLTNRLLRQCPAGRLTPTAIDQLSDQAIRSIGVSHTKVATIRTLTTAIMAGTINLERYRNLSDQAIITDLTRLKGIGPWSAKMYLIFSLDRPNILPFEDGAFLQGYGWVYKTTDYRRVAVEKKCRKWRPYSSLAARYLYHARDAGLTKHPFHLFK
ncbi:DNA-3-methyladenine glycosylase family protein [Levilactobacillus namurensis]|uniref:DNA-3-methyladenine glycosylase family protein n=1 Tax=Levilactobacillus namurensis TaxID=380393 RepID=UPI001D937786|nr:DNA-3-methyladenine glycosylase 2 family protein [Levilactobacillus namurensis]HJE44397.1 DNA-3-methyladenine glycosylase 2 family protein [Levilactobacillus namurensis]